MPRLCIRSTIRIIQILWHLFISVLRYSLLAVVLMAVLNQIASFALPLYINLIFAAIGRFLFGIYNVVLGFEAIKRLPFLLRIFIQLFIVQLIIMLAAIAPHAVTTPLGYDLWGGALGSDLLSAVFLPVYFRTQIFMFFLILVVGIEIILGRSFFLNYLLGAYNSPKKEHSIFMFLDLT